MTPLEAAARAITAKDEWGADQIGCGAGNSDCRNGHCLECSRLVVRAALSAAIEALPEQSVELDSWVGTVHAEIDKSALRRAFGLGDQG